MLRSLPSIWAALFSLTVATSVSSTLAAQESSPLPFPRVVGEKSAVLVTQQDDPKKADPKKTPSDKKVVDEPKKVEPKPEPKPDPAAEAAFKKMLEDLAKKAAEDATKKALDEAAAKDAEAKKKADDDAKKAADAAKVIADKAEAEAKKKADDDAKKAAEDAKKTADSITAAADAGSSGKSLGNNAWMLTASAFVLLMTPGLALFYGGMVRRKNVLATMMQSYASMAIVGLYWVAVGYGLAFGPSQIKLSLLGVEDGGIIGWHSSLFFLQGISPADKLPGYDIPVLTHVMFQGMFAIITPALISGAVAERIRFWPWTIFSLLWVTFVYCPLAHMVWAWDWFGYPADELKGFGGSAIGLLGKMGALDFAGGTVVHIAAGFSGLACIVILRKRKGYPEHVMHPNSMVLTLIGAGLLWFGWFGFNGGSGLNASDLASTGFATTQAAAAGAGLSWILVEWIFKGKPTALGLASGIVAGLVAVTPAAGYVYVWGGAMIGIIAGVVCYLSVQVKSMLGYDDSLDAFGVHGVGGFLGAVLTGVFCYAAIQAASADGMLAHMNLKGNIDGLKKEVESLKKEIDATEKSVPEAYKAQAAAVKTDKKDAALAELKTKAEETAAAAKEAKDDKDKDKAAKEASDAAQAAHKMVRLQGIIDRIEHKKDEKDDKDKPGDIEFIENKIKTYETDKKGSTTQLFIQIKASVFSAVLAFVLSLGLAFLTQVITLGNFRTSDEKEVEGLDSTEHGEVGFDFGGLDTLPISVGSEPKAAKAPPGGKKRFEVIVEGIENGGLIHAWSELCQPKEGPLDPDFKAVYPYVTTVQGNRFRLRGGDPKSLAANIQRLFTKKLGKPVKVRVEE